MICSNNTVVSIVNFSISPFYICCSTRIRQKLKKTGSVIISINLKNRILSGILHEFIVFRYGSIIKY